MTKFLAIIGIEEPTGASKVTNLFTDFVKKHNIKTLVFNYKLSFNKNDKHKGLNFGSRICKFIYFLKNFYRVYINISKIKAGYIQENHGLGKVFDILFIILFLIHKKKCFYHNHSSWKYLRFDLATKVIQILSNFNVINIFLSNQEFKKFSKKYGRLRKHFFMSNSVFLKDLTSFKNNFSNTDTLKLGLLSNLTKDKGLDNFIELAKYSIDNQNPWKFYLAGPIVKNKDFYLNKINNLSNLKYLGKINNDKDKLSFYQNLDFFIFLTSYRNESEPLVLLEAISNGCIPVVYDKGSIADLICSKKLILDQKTNPSYLITILIKEIIKKQELKNLSIASSKLYKNLRQSSKRELYKLIKEIKSL